MPAGAGPVVTLIATGGTISTTVDPAGRSAATRSGRDLQAIAQVAGVRIVTLDIARRPSWSMTPADMASIAVTARDAARATTLGGVVVTHGTTTLEQTAFLCHLFLDVDTPVVLTGAMRRADDPTPDGPSNLADAIRVAADPRARGRGALVSFAGRILSGGSAWKAHRTDPDAFVDLLGDVGRISGSEVTFDRSIRREPPFSGEIDERVALVKAFPGASGSVVDAAYASGIHGMVVEALPGSGGIPPEMLPAVTRVAERVPLVIASRAPYGVMPDPPTGGTGEPLLELELLSAGRLTAEQSVLLLMVALADGQDDAQIRARFRAVASDTTARGG